MGLVLGIDASSSNAGGGVRHLTEFLRNLQPPKYGVEKVLVWARKSTLDALPAREWLIKKNAPALEKNILHRVYFWFFKYDAMLREECDIVFSTGGTFVSKFRPFVAMSRNMLVFDKKESYRYPLLSISRLRLKLLNVWQSKTFFNASGVIFISEYARELITRQIGIENKLTTIVHHGISEIFFAEPREQIDFSSGAPIEVLYVSSIDEYKHQWNVVRAIGALRKEGFNIHLSLIGGVTNADAKKRLDDAMDEVDPSRGFIQYKGLVSHDAMHVYYQKSDIFVFASTCENMPNTLIEAMSAGLPIVCSHFDPMPEFIREATVYIDPTDAKSVQEGLHELISDKEKRARLAAQSYKLAREYSWEKCVHGTMHFLLQVHKSYHARLTIQPPRNAS